jgi:hypothetical protein
MTFRSSPPPAELTFVTSASSSRHFAGTGSILVSGKSKSKWFARSLLSLGALITDDGIAVDPLKWDKIANWPTPRNKKDVLRFQGTINWMCDYLKDLASVMAPLTALTGSREWQWGDPEEAAFAEVKSMVPALLKPIDWEKVRAGEHKLYVFTDASITGVGVHINLGPDRASSMPYHFYSAKFNPTQVNYDTTNQELLAVVSAVKQFEQHLVGWKFVVVSDHEPLKRFWTTAPTLTRRHIRMYNELSCFNFEMEFIPGKDNVITDSLSRV